MPPRDLNPVIHQPARLLILAALYRNRQASFTALRDGLGLTPGNLASHAAKLEEFGYIRSGRVLVGVAFELRYRITPEGDVAFRSYAETLRTVLAASDAAPAGENRHAARDGPGSVSQP